MQKPPKIPCRSYVNFFSIPKLQRPENESEDDNYYICPLCESNGAPMRSAMLKMSNILKHTTTFSKTELGTLIRIFYEIKGKIKNAMSYQNLRIFFQSTFGVLCPMALEGIVRAFDSEQTKTISPENFVTGMHIILQGTIAEKASFAFRVFDVDRDGYLRRKIEFDAPMQRIFKTDIAANNPEVDPEEPKRETVEYLLRKMDLDKDGKVSHNDFVEAVKQEPLLLECIFSFMPSEENVIVFKRLLMSRHDVQSLI